MKILKRICLTMCLLGFLYTACDSPVQTLDRCSKHVFHLKENCLYNPVCSPNGNTIAYSGRHRVSVLFVNSMQTSYRDSFYILDPPAAYWPDVPQLSPDGSHRRKI